MKTEQIKREWLQFVDTLPKYVGQTPENVIADWWLQKLEEQRLEAHKTNNGWCCACEYDQIELNRRLEEQKQGIAEEVEKLRKVYDADTTEREMIDPACVDGFNIALDTVLSIINK